ncbi:MULTISPECIES: glycosyltransferase [Bacillus]|uniref:glycosyltransferase n=1 Tax=Bacillus TaxID=1386 RepID=UPI000BEFB323|nr:MULTISPECIES: glycosyltransferase [Bacillus cereus group]MBJ8044276.1 glycosyltransferase [Bacillus cereus group sp. N17]PEJ00648.1 glycosyl transferase [Bacillus toyonensis]HDR3908615.1 glycosyltransferase [Bacillus toyonensis]HDR7409223.1 glycosyltransferase [Bacillus toyonensis]HDR7850610.1 glycosyltransferase [Bacillus toyonensis]
MNNIPENIEHMFKRIVRLKSKMDRNKAVSELLKVPEYNKEFLLRLRTEYSTNKTENVSVVTCTNKPQFIENIILNYINQTWINKELILILNKNDLDIHYYQEKTTQYKNIFIYQLPEETSLGRCYNFAAKKTNYDYIATFDDDDFYAPNYITDLMHAFQYTDADIVGKLSYFIYFEDKEILAIRNPYQEYKYLDSTSFLDGGKKIVKKKVLDTVQYRDVSLLEDVYFCQDSIEKGFKIFSADKYNLAYLRRINKENHTWKEQDDTILKWCSVVTDKPPFKHNILV